MMKVLVESLISELSVIIASVVDTAVMLFVMYSVLLVLAWLLDHFSNNSIGCFSVLTFRKSNYTEQKLAPLVVKSILALTVIVFVKLGGISKIIEFMYKSFRLLWAYF